jgi:hypothetical protein
MSLAPVVKRRLYLWGGATLVVVAILVTTLIVAESRHDPQGSAATSARTRADPALVAALDDVEARLSLGRPTSSAVEDMCHATKPVSQDRSITCVRHRYRAYPSAYTSGGASTVASPLKAPWLRQESFCDADIQTSTACFRAGDVDLEVMAITESSGRSIQGPEVEDNYVESDYWKFRVSTPSIVLIASSTYYVG